MANKDKFLELLRSTNREGVEDLITKLEEVGFFEAPASSKFHGDYPGGLLEHSLNVYQQAAYLYKVETHIKPDLAPKIPMESIIIASLLHDVCKADLYMKVKKWKKDETKPKGQQWEQKEVYDHDYTKFPLGHGEKSVIWLLKNGFKLTDDEIMAIRWHMGSWDLSTYSDSKACFNAASDSCPLLAIIICADTLAARITEVRGISQQKQEEPPKQS